MFHHFGWKLPIQGQIFRVLGVNRVQISIFHFITPSKGTSLLVSASFEPLRVKIRPGVSSLRCSEKKIKKSHTKRYISPLCPEVPSERIFTKFGTNVPLMDIINSDKLYVNLFKGFDFTGVKVSIFPIGN